MSNEFINCPKCGLRNFSSYKICGICKSNLSKTLKVEQVVKDPIEPKKNNYFIVVLLFVVIGFIWYNVLTKDKTANTTETEVSENLQKTTEISSTLNSTTNNNNANIEKTKEPVAKSSCNDEKAYLTNTINDLKLRIKELKQSYRELKYDEMAWDKFISEYNRYTWQINDETRDLSFQCIDNYLFKNLKTAYGLIGINYIHGPTKIAIDMENKFKEVSNQITKELKNK